MRAESYIDSIENVSDLHALEDVAAATLADCGFSSFFMGMPHSKVSDNTFGRPCDPGFLAHYQSSGLSAVDPIAQKLEESWLPIAWDALELRKSSDETCAYLFEQSAKIGHERGISAAIHGPCGTHYAVVGIFDGPQERFRSRISALSHRLLMIGTHLARAHSRLTAKDRAAKAGLTPRECECLQWSYRGKTARETAIIMGTTERTVHFHLQNAMHKLESPSKHHSSRKAFDLGLISL
jgi:LuxR family transcriptional regulator, activator of conjugal transfer of Ti plasmids